MNFTYILNIIININLLERKSNLKNILRAISSYVTLIYAFYFGILTNFQF